MAVFLQRLESIRRLVRRRLVAYGVCAVLAGGVASFLTVVTLDWFLWLPAVLRLFVAVLFFSGFVLATIHWVVTPLQTPLRVEHIAARLESHFESLNDRLSSAVNFLRATDPGSPRMVARVLEDTERSLRELPLETALARQPLLRAAGTLAFAGAVLCCILILSPGWVRTGVTRYVTPYGDTEWPRSVEIIPRTQALSVAVGESVTVRMNVARGLTDTLRGIVHLREPDGDVVSLAMHRDEQGEFFATIDSVTEDLTYWFEAGDNTTERRPEVIHAVRRPELVEAIAVVAAPDYVPDAVPRTHDLRDGPVRAPQGGRVTVELLASKPISTDSDTYTVGLIGEDGRWVSLLVDAADPRRAVARFSVTSDFTFRVNLVDEEGFENRGAALLAILATPDRPPTVTIVEPASIVELTPKASLRLVARVEDDFGVGRIELETQRQGDEAVDSITLTDSATTARRDEGVEVIAGYDWDLAGRSLSPGDLIVYSVVAIDNRAGESLTPQIGRSAPMRLKIISEAEFEIRLRDELALLEDGIRQAALEQADIQQSAAALARTGETFPGLSDEERQAAAGLAAREARLVRILRETSGRFAQLHQRMNQNLAGDPESRARVAALGDSLSEIALGPVAGAGASFHTAADQSAAAAQQDALTEATNQSAAALEQLRAVLNTMSQWGDFQGMVARTRDLLDRQEDVRAATAAVGKSMLGKTVESLTDEEEAALKRNQRQQEQVSEDVDQLLARMNELLDDAQERDPSGAQALDDALRAARAQDLLKRTRGAAESIGKNRTAAAAIDQQAAADAMRRMVKALRERESRELELLRKQVAEAADQVRELLVAQRDLRAATAEAGLLKVDAAAFATLEEDQRTLRRNTRFLGEELADSEKIATAGRLVRDAAAPMMDAENQLQQSAAEPATSAQDRALDLLTQAVDALDQLAEAVAQQALQRSLAQIHEDLSRLLAMQQAVNAGIAELREMITKAGRLGRAEAREAARLAREQAATRDAVDEILTDLKKVPVYDWALTRVADWMQTARGWLDERKIDDELTATTRRVERELEKLIAAIRATQDMPLDTEFVEAEGGSGQSRAMSTKPVPTVAELLVLKAMQEDVNTRTRTLHETLDLDNADEAQLRELRTIGEDQAQVRRLTEMVTTEARQ